MASGLNLKMKEPSESLDYLVYGNSNTTGFGIHCRNIIKALCNAGKTVAFMPVQGIEYQKIDNKYIEMALNNRSYVTHSEPAIAIYHSCLDFKGKPRMGFAIFETDKIKQNDINYYNSLDVVLVPSRWGKSILIQNNVPENKIKIVHEGFDNEVFRVTQNAEEILHRMKQRGYITMLHVGKFEKRKSSVSIIQAFKQAVNETGIQAQLLMKCENPFNLKWYEEFDYARGSCNCIHIFYGEGQKTEKQIAEIYHNADFGLYASRGEAWGLGALEGIACGLPTITTNFSGQSEYLKDYPDELLIKNGTKEIADDSVFFKGDRGNWIVPDRDELKEKIKYVLQNSESIIMRKQEFTDSVRRFTWENAVKGLFY